MSPLVEVPCQVRRVTADAVEIREGSGWISSLPRSCVAEIGEASILLPDWLARPVSAPNAGAEVSAARPAPPAAAAAPAAPERPLAPKPFAEPHERIDDDDMAAWRAAWRQSDAEGAA